ncbi:MAG: Transport system permease protein [Anaerolinea thermophila]|uniref:Transport system permease protein n=1 Tax=Anaerolinea thermophila TaxID=167964 RepID=A0A101FYB1_9CHLR|nr:MAG: Transport system permease protein [Anaerolinea thermophila]
MGISLFIGRYPQPIFTPVRLLWEDELAKALILNIRLPRLIAAALLGASLSISGYIFQMAFSNPLADGGILGVNQAAGFGAALAIITTGYTFVQIQISALLFGILSIFLVLLLSRIIKTESTIINQIFAGIAISAIFSSGIGILKYMADPLQELPNIVFWLLGDLSSITWERILPVIPQILIGISILWALRWRVNALALDENVSFSLGAGKKRETYFILFIAVLLTASVISYAGLVGWIGLIIPNIVRTIFGTTGQKSIPATLMIGAGYAVICDTLARTLIPGEIPLGILTAILGAIAMIVLVSAGKIRIKE